MWRLKVIGKFEAAHYLPGVPVCEQLHGHTWKVEVELESRELDSKGMVVDFRQVKDTWKELDHRLLNEFLDYPTCENLAKYLYDKLTGLWEKKVKVIRVTIWEDDCAATYEPV